MHDQSLIVSTCRGFMFLGVAITCTFANDLDTSSAISKEADAGAQARETRLKTIKRMVSRYELFGGNDGKKKLDRSAEAVLRWTNPERATDDGCVFLWTNAGVPEAVASIYPTPGENGEFWEHEFQSLSRGGLVAERDGNPVWTPEKPGVEFKSLPEAPMPADTAVKRSSQMRTLAGRFTAHVFVGSNKTPVRPLTTPIYRYSGSNGELVDGVVFAFVQGTDPEMLLLLEARREDDGLHWHYALARMTSVQVEALYDDKPIWSIRPWNGYPTLKQPYFTFALQPPD